MSAPTEAERAHDYLWRIHQKVPGAGEITVFNRSHYEDVLVPAVNGWITPEQHHQRFGHINDFERMLTHTLWLRCAELRRAIVAEAQGWIYFPESLASLDDAAAQSSSNRAPS